MANFPRRRAKNGVPSAPKASRFSKFARQPVGEAAGKKSLRRRGIYLLPNAFTTAALFCGFYAIVMAMNLKFEHAAWAIFIAMILDGLDGRIARLTNTQSEFGAQYDSLSDMVSFGAAPALVIYEWSLRGMGKMGWLAAFVYCAGGALRLARFNTNIEVVDKRFFQGLPSPAAAAMVAGYILLMEDVQVSGVQLAWVSWCIALFAGLTMVSNVPFYSFKDVNFRKSVPFIAVFLIALAFALVSIDPPKVLFPIFVAYGLSGYAVYFWRMAKGKPVSIIQTDKESVDRSERR
ncbi:CDP-diacylglycerol---serine O-phosphatidyltransferase [Janthinobacterium sp. CG_23.3]|uniref:CDP-diacylglycerol--serine O-phosphatidyltransferase n=1 Tax=unclassified Janthinobacterium TaxID=2610881 RepID=UPI000477552C|nr:MULTISPECIES: CDP-diacylglycerol--serine O-phosphatidyltransferase [unclassified Janthinobacterium]MEC5159345.1 CDP-diacylglycerol--serine O-phosphatidyltransferase [Janthinobacterium sp. CG_S6]